MKIRLGLILLIIAILVIAGVGFFMFTTTLSSPTTMELYMPKVSKDSVDKYSQVKTKLTLILLKDYKVFGYYGDSMKGGRSVSVDETDKLISDGRKMFSTDSLVIVIKPSNTATYQETVDILDKMSINKIGKYSMTDLNRQEKDFLKIAE